ncbi:MAG TPA: hypothetical protein VKV17_06535 [Bryobacteraceae bacterium]|nr:hypothetical protein [Bryobacteraceae bacterium]
MSDEQYRKSDFVKKSMRIWAPAAKLFRREHGQEDRTSEQRATLVRDYLIQRLSLKPELTGAMPLSDRPPEQTGDTAWDGISLVLLP